MNKNNVKINELLDIKKLDKVAGGSNKALDWMKKNTKTVAAIAGAVGGLATAAAAIGGGIYAYKSRSSSLSLSNGSPVPTSKEGQTQYYQQVLTNARKSLEEARWFVELQNQMPTEVVNMAQRNIDDYKHQISGAIDGLRELGVKVEGEGYGVIDRTMAKIMAPREK